jgi:hypothetical protein
METITFQKDFVVAIRSLNTNAFGLRKHILIAKDGEAHSVLLSHLSEVPAATVVTATVELRGENGRRVTFASLSGECQQAEPECPQAFAEEFWQTAGHPDLCDPYCSRQHR